MAENNRPTYIDFLVSFNNRLFQDYYTPNEQLVYHTLLMINNACLRSEWFYRTDEQLTGVLKISIKAFKNARNSLQQKGAIDYVSSKVRGTCTKYKICDDFCTYQKTQQRNNNRTTDEQQRDNKGITDGTPYKKKNKIENKSITPIVPFEGTLGDKVSEWLQYKQERGQKYKSTGLNSLFRKIQDETDKHSEAFVLSVIDRSITNNWQGLFFDSGKQNSGGADSEDNGQDDYSSIGWG